MVVQLTCLLNFIKECVMLETKQKGIVTELECITAFNQLGYHVSIPYGENSRYDFIADIDGVLIRVQAKTSSPIDDDCHAIQFSCRSSRINSKGTVNTRYTKDEIDYFCTYYNGMCYLVPVEETSVSKTLRFTRPKSSQDIKINYAKDYELESQINKIKETVKH